MFQSTKTTLSLALGTSMLFVGIATAHAQSVNVQFVTASTPHSTEPGAANIGTTYNYFDFGGATQNANNLVSSTGSGATNVNLVYNNVGGESTNGTGTIQASDAPNLTTGYVYSGAGSTIVISGLSASPTLYNLYLYGDGGPGTVFTINGTGVTNIPTTAAHTLTSGVDYVSFTNIAASAGSITVSLASANPASDSNAHVNGFQLQAVAAPEPSQTAVLSLGILGLAGLGWKARRRRSA
jgi:hypothetical protein